MNKLGLSMDDKHLLDVAAINIVKNHHEFDDEAVKIAMEHLAARRQEIMREILRAKIMRQVVTWGFWLTPPICALLVWELFRLLGVL